MNTPRTSTVPGFRRRFRITPSPGHVLSEVEDDFHRMSVGIQHADGVARAVRASLERAPWSTCPGSVSVCEQTFTGAALKDFATRKGKASNCTHLFDLAQLAAAHAFDDAVLVYDIFVADPVDGTRRAELLRNGDRVLAWSYAKYTFTEPAALAGTKLDDIRAWLDTLPPARQEEARVLRWASMIAHGRTIPLHRQSNAKAMPPSCYSFQPEQAAVAQRIGISRDFSQGLAQPLAV
jgi:hypothetical protein